MSGPSGDALGGEDAGLTLPASAVYGEARERLRVRWGVPRLYLFDRVGSTNDIARALAERGAAAGTTLLAREQVAGRGRSGREWSSAPDLGLWTSMVARPARRSLPGPFPLLAALHVARALETFLGPVTIGLKWPNDLVIGRRKLAGVLCEAWWAGENPMFAVVGVGINILQTESDFPLGLREHAISLRAAGANVDSVLPVADRAIPALLAAVTGSPELDREALADLSARDVLAGSPVSVADPVSGRPLHRGVAAGIDSSGALVLRTPDGALEAVQMGTVRPMDDYETRR